MIQQSPTERALDVLARLQAAPDINHARIVTAQREAEYIIPQSLRDDLIEFASQAAQPAEADGCNCGIGDQSDIGHYHESWCAALATPKAPATDAGEVAADCSCEVAFGQNEECPAHGTGTAWRAANPQADMRAQPYGQFTTPPAPNDDLRAAIAAALPGIAAMVENIERWRETGAVAGPDESRSLYEGLRASLAALKENHRG